MILTQEVTKAAGEVSTSCHRKVRGLKSASDLTSSNSKCVRNVCKCRTWKELGFNQDENGHRTRGKREEGRGKAFSD